MTFKMKYEIKSDFIAKGKRRPGTYIAPKFGVLHDTGNPGSTAQNNRNYYNNTPNDPSSASAHTFIDDGVILECVPATTAKTERAFHVRYQQPQDNALFGDDANDIAIGVELCFGGKINFEEAYKRYVWYCAYVSYKFGFSPTKWIGHEKLDPGRKTDPTNALKRYGKTYGQLLADILKEYAECTEPTLKAAVVKTSVKPVVKAPAKSVSVPSGVLRKGDRGSAVKVLQNALNSVNFKCGTADGVFGANTENALKRFQSMYYGLTVDGVYGPKTAAKLKGALK